MPNTILIKKSTVSGVIPGSLASGELAINTADSKIFIQNAAGVITNLTSNKLDHTNGTSTGIYETVINVPLLDIDVSSSNVQTASITADSTFTFSGWTTDSSAVILELTTTNTPVITFTGVTWAYLQTPVTGPFMRLIFTSTNNGTTVRGSIIEDGS